MTVQAVNATHDKGKRQAQLMRGFLSVLERTVRVFTQRGTTIRAESGGSYPSWTDGKDVYLNFGALGAPSTAQDVVKIVGAAIHEACHILYTPSLNNGWYSRDFNSAYVRHFPNREVSIESVRTVWNILEDQRIESIFVSRFPSTAGYFISMFNAFVFTGTDVSGRGYMFAAGRLYLPAKVRKSLRKSFSMQDKVDKLESLILEYRTLDPMTSDGSYRSIEIVMEVASLFENKEYEIPSPPCVDRKTHNHNGASGKENQEGAAKVREEDQEREDQEQEDAADAASQDDLDDSADGSDSSDGSEDVDSDDDSDSSSDGSGDTDDASDSDDGEGSSDGDADSEQGGGAGTADTDEPDEVLTKQELIDMLEEAVQQDDDFQKEIESIRNAARNTNRPNSNIDKVEGTSVPVSVVSKQHAVKASNAFKKLSARLDPFWQDDSNSGVLDWRKAAQETPPMTGMFRQWDHGVDDAGSIAAVVLLDRSGSMRGPDIKNATVATWVIKRSIELAGGKCAVIAYNGHEALLADFNEPASASHALEPAAGGGTLVIDAQKEATLRLSMMKARHKWIFIVSDGDFSDGTREITEANKETHDYGVRIAAFGYGMGEYWLSNYKDAGYDHMQIIRSWDGFADGVKEVVGKSIKSVSRYGRR